jgi:flap endonuclease-1
MGIKGINDLIKRHAPTANFVMPMTDLAGKRVAVDAHHWMYSYMAIALKKVLYKTDVAAGKPDVYEIRKEWLYSVVGFVLNFLHYNVTPIFVFDGTSPAAKDDTKAKRGAVKAAARTKIDALYEALKANGDPNGDIVADLHKELRNYVVISEDDSDMFKMLLSGIGIPCLQAVSEGEQLCSMLCSDGVVAGVYSSDTDCLTYGCPLMITGFAPTTGGVTQLECVRLDTILTGLNISMPVFVDLCIMCGCDHNTNIPGYAAIKSYALLQKHTSIDNIPRHIDSTCLNHVMCRDLFRYRPSNTLIDANNKIKLNRSTEVDRPISYDVDVRSLDGAREHLEMSGLSNLMDRISEVYQHLKPSSAGHVERLQLQSVRPRIKLVVVAK